MRVEVMHHYGLVHPLNRAGYYETDHHRRLLQDIREALPDGRLIAVCGVVGAGKTLFLRRLQQLLREESRVIVSQSLAVEKHSIKLSTLIDVYKRQSWRWCGFGKVGAWCAINEA